MRLTLKELNIAFDLLVESTRQIAERVKDLEDKVDDVSSALREHLQRD